MKYIKFTYQGVELEADRDFVNASPADRITICNGIGPAWLFEMATFLRQWFNLDIRWFRYMLNRIWGLDCTIIGDIHDWDYYYSEPRQKYKNEADDRFHRNLDAWITQKSRWVWLRKLRMRRVHKYSYMLKEWGFKAFYDRG